MTTINASARERLQEISQRLNASRDGKAAAQKAVELAVRAGDDQAQHAANVALQQAIGAIERDRELQALVISQVSGISHAAGVTALDDPNVVGELQRVAHSSGRIGRLNVGEVIGADQLVGMINAGDWGSRTMAVATDPTVPDSARTSFYGIVPQPRRQLRLLDLIPSQTMETGSFHYAIEGGDITTGVSEVTEAALKGQGDSELTDAEVIAATIAVWNKIPKQQLADVGSLQTWITSRLSYAVLRRLESEILSGNGVAPNLKGILNTTGIASVAFDADAVLADLALAGAVDVQLSDGTPNAVILNPADLKTMLIAKASGSGEYLSGGAFTATPSELWGLPTIVSTAMPVGKALIGDFSQGCSLFVRQGVNVVVSDADSDDFTRNKVTVLAEGRFGLAVWQPSMFATVALAA